LKFTFTIIFLSLFFHAKAQKKRLPNYYSLIYAAEKFIIEERLDSASVYFKKGFQKKKHPFARHLYNAAVVDSKLRNYKNVTKYLKKLIKLGASFYQIQRNKSFLSFFSSKKGVEFIKNYRKIKPIYTQQYRNQIEKMVEDDQFFRVKKGSYSTYGDTILKIDKKNIENFLSLLKELGFPSEHKIGIDTNYFPNPLYLPIIIHQTMGSMQQYDFTSILKQNVLEGNIENKAGDFMINSSSGNNFYEIVKAQYVKLIDTTILSINPNNIIVLDSSDWGYFPLSEKEATMINEKRKKLYLDTYEENIIKALFSLKSKEYRLSSSGANSILEFTNHSDFIDMRQKIKIYKNK